MAIIFDGRAFAFQKEKQLKIRIGNLIKKGITPKMVSIIVGDDRASKLYVGLKKQAAERIGAEVTVQKFSASTSKEKIIEFIDRLNKDSKIYGIIVQLPLPAEIRHETLEIINTIDSQKDIDGLRPDSPFLHATAKAVVDIIASLKLALINPCVVVVGDRGMVGRPLLKKLVKEGYRVKGCNSTTKNLKESTLKADILVSAAGVPGLIKKDMVKQGVVAIDVGAPKGDIDPSAWLRASFFTPVPGGVGPVTISCLLENLIQACYTNLKFP